MVKIPQQVKQDLLDFIFLFHPFCSPQSKDQAAVLPFQADRSLSTATGWIWTICKLSEVSFELFGQITTPQKCMFLSKQVHTDEHTLHNSSEITRCYEITKWEQKLSKIDR